MISGIDEDCEKVNDTFPEYCNQTSCTFKSDYKCEYEKGATVTN